LIAFASQCGCGGMTGVSRGRRQWKIH
jgi:hypothetical protein